MLVTSYFIVEIICLLGTLVDYIVHGVTLYYGDGDPRND